MKKFGRLIVTALVVMAFVVTAAVVIQLQAAGVPSAKVIGTLFFAAMVGMALSANEPRQYEYGDSSTLPVAASTTIYEGAAVGDNGSGYARGLTAGDPFRGFAEEKIDNSSGSAGDKRIRLRTKGIIKLSVTSLAITNVGDDVFASDDGTFVLTATSNTRIGTVHRFVSSGVGMIAFDTAEAQSVGTSEIADGAVTTDKLGADAVTGAKIADDSVSLEHLDPGITPSHITVFSGEHTTTGGAAAEAITVTGALESDIAVVTIHTVGSTPRTIVSALISAEDTLTVTFSDDPSNDHVVAYQILRAVS